MTDLAVLKDEVKNKAQHYAEGMIRYLKANCDKFPEYAEYRSSEDIAPASSDYFNGILFCNSPTRRDCTNNYYDGFK